MEVILSAEGVRMGCPLGSFGFDLALQTVLERCVARKSSAGIVVRSLTDDCNLAVQLPATRWRPTPPCDACTVRSASWQHTPRLPSIST